jgi:hypothetical protein
MVRNSWLVDCRSSVYWVLGIGADVLANYETIKHLLVS